MTMDIKLDIPPLYQAELRLIAKETLTTYDDVVSGIVKFYLDGNAKHVGKRPGPGHAIKDQHGNRYSGITEAAQKLGLHKRLISYVLSGVRGHTGGYRFTYEK